MVAMEPRVHKAEEPRPKAGARADNATYDAKDDRYRPAPVGSVVAAEAARSTRRLLPKVGARNHRSAPVTLISRGSEAGH